MDELSEKYAILNSTIKEAKEEQEKIKAQILEIMASSGEKTVETGVGKFSVTKLKTWTYPAFITGLEENLEASKEKAKSTGEATYVEKDSLRFTQISL